MKRPNGPLPWQMLLEKRVRWPLRSSEFNFEIIHRSSIKHQPVDALFRPIINGTAKTPLEDDIPALPIPQYILACALKTGTTDFQFIEEPEGVFVPFNSEDCVMAGITENDKAEIPTLAESISAQSTNTESCSALESVGNRALALMSMETEC